MMALHAACTYTTHLQPVRTPADFRAQAGAEFVSFFQGGQRVADVGGRPGYNRIAFFNFAIFLSSVSVVKPLSLYSLAIKRSINPQPFVAASTSSVD